MGMCDPKMMEHWSSSNFVLKPTLRDFYWTFVFTFVIGVYSLTSILYRARHIVTYDTKDDAMIRQDEE